MATNHTVGDGQESPQTNTDSATTGWRGRIAVLAAGVALALLGLSLASPVAAGEHANETNFTATNSGGELRVAGEQFSLPAGDIVVTGVAEDGRWTSTDVEFAEQSVNGFSGEVTASNGLSGTFDRENDLFTLQGTLVITVLGTNIVAEIDASSRVADIPTRLTGPDAQAAVADDEFVVDETGNAAIDQTLGLPADDAKQNQLRLPFELSFPDTNEDTADEGDENDAEAQLPAGSEVEVETDRRGRRSVNATVPNARGGRPIELPVSGSDDDNESFAARSLSITPREDGDVTVNATASVERLATTPDQRAGFAPNTTQLGYVSVGTNLADDDVAEFALTTRVNRSRLRALGTDAEAVSLDRFNESQQRWVEQNTTIVERTERSVLLRAVADHPSEWIAAAARPEFEIAQTDVAVTAARAGESVAIDIVVENTGGTEGRYRADLLLNGEVVDSQETAIAKGGQALFDFQPAFEEAGTYEVQVNDVLIDEIEVTAEEATTDGKSTTDGSSSDTDSTDGDSVDGGGNGFGLVAALIAVLAAGLYARHRDY